MTRAKFELLKNLVITRACSTGHNRGDSTLPEYYFALLPLPPSSPPEIGRPEAEMHVGMVGAKLRQQESQRASLSLLS